MNGRRLDEALIDLRVQFLLRIAQHLGLETDADEVRELLGGRTDGEVLDGIVSAHRPRLRWKRLARWVIGLGGLRDA